MRVIRPILALLFALLVSAAFADNPKNGVYTVDKEGDRVKGEITLAKRGAHFQVTGNIKFPNGVTTVKGTLYTSTWNFKGTIKGKDNKGKPYEKPINGSWDHKSNTLTMLLPGGRLTFESDDQSAGDKGPDFTGTWDTSFGKMTLTQSGKKVSGTYDYYGGTIDGEIRADGQLYFKWTQTNDRRGTGAFRLASGAATFSGWWDYTLSDGKAAGNGGGWSGKRIK